MGQSFLTSFALSLSLPLDLRVAVMPSMGQVWGKTPEKTVRLRSAMLSMTLVASLATLRSSSYDSVAAIRLSLAVEPLTCLTNPSNLLPRAWQTQLPPHISAQGIAASTEWPPRFGLWSAQK